MLGMQILAIYLLSSIAVIILAFFLRMKLTLGWDLAQSKNWPKMKEIDVNLLAKVALHSKTAKASHNKRVKSRNYTFGENV